MTTWKGGQLRVGVLGAGMITTVSYGFLPGLQTISDRVQVVAIASRTRSLAEKVATNFNIPAVYDSLSDMLADAELDAVINATPGPAHYATSIEILSAGKHLITDKPLASTVAEADEMCALAEANELLIVCAPYDMLSREWRESRRLIAAGAVGNVALLGSSRPTQNRREWRGRVTPPGSTNKVRARWSTWTYTGSAVQEGVRESTIKRPGAACAGVSRGQRRCSGVQPRRIGRSGWTPA